MAAPGCPEWAELKPYYGKRLISIIRLFLFYFEIENSIEALCACLRIYATKEKSVSFFIA